MSTLDEITKEKQRISEALARVDMQRDKLASQLGELEATERVLALQQGREKRPQPDGRPRQRRWPLQRDDMSPRRRQKPLAASAVRRTLGDQILALTTGKTQQEIAAACKGARPNHVDAALARHKRAGLIEERDGKLYAIPSTRTDQPAAL
jgi:hypothetical protein